ncbi:MAG: class I SAM-dependent methyltransferase [Acidimicrobiia bacterium]|nr:class I SAM-dependent methyltransferase [Acidimicrobiia bacterium]
MRSLFSNGSRGNGRRDGMYDSKRYALINHWDKRHMVTVSRFLDPLPTDRILEVGCGVGHLTRRLRELGADAIGIDANPHAAENAVTEGVTTGNAEALDFPDDSFDKIVSLHAIEHIPHIEAALSEMARVLRPGGKALLVYPAEPIQGIWAVPTAIVLHRNPFKAREVHCHWLWPSKVRTLAAPHGFTEDRSEFMLLSSPQFVSLFSLAARSGDSPSTCEANG